MNDYILIGKIVNTHGIKGELRILSDFEYKNKIFIKDFKLYLGNKKEEFSIESYRIHKSFDMILFKEINNINEVLIYKGVNVYIKRSDLILKEDEYLINDLFGYEVKHKDKIVGKVVDILKNNGNIVFEIKGEIDIKIPLCDEYIIKINKESREIITENIERLML